MDKQVKKPKEMMMHDEHEQKPDPVLLGLISQREATSGLNPSPSFSSWINKGSTSHPRSEDQIGPSLIKNEPWSRSSDVAYPQSLASAYKVWTGMNSEPAKATLKKPELDSKTQGAKFATKDKEEVKLMLKESRIPTRPRSGLKRKVEEFHPPKDNKVKKTAETLFCELCQISCSGKIVMQQHLIGRQHKAKMEYRKLKRGGTTNGDRRGKPMCEVCEIWCTDRDALQLHFNGQKHKGKVKEVEDCGKNGGQKGKSSLVICELCHVPCMNQELYQMHLKGKPHAWEELKRNEMVKWGQD